MTEIIGGNVGLMGLEVKEKFVFFRFMKERKELMKIIYFLLSFAKVGIVLYICDMDKQVRNNIRLVLNEDEYTMIDGIAAAVEAETGIPLRYGKKRNIIQVVRYCIRQVFNEKCQNA